MKKNYLLLFMTGLLNLNIFCQTTGGAFVNYPITVNGTNATNNNILKRGAFVIDNNDSKWIGFNLGASVSFQLARYNGTQWDTFPAFNALSATNKVNALAVDANNNIWIGSNLGLTKYNGSTFTNYNTSNSGIVSDTITALACGNGNVYAGSNRGLSVYNGSNFTNYNQASNGMHSNIVNCITYESPNAIWLGDNSGLEKFDGSNFTFNYVSGTTADVINCIYVDAQSNKWIGTNAHGTIKYDNSNFYSMLQLFPLQATEEILGAAQWPSIVKTICQGPRGGVIFSSLTAPVNGGNSTGSIEIKGSNLYTYPAIAATNTVSGSHAIMQYDYSLNKIFVVTATGSYVNLLQRFDTIPTTNNMYGLTSSTSAFLDINNISCLIDANAGNHFDYVGNQAKYFSPSSKGTSPLHASSLWVGGYAGGTVRTAAMTYRQNGYDFWPGEINPNTGGTDSACFNFYNRVWKINRSDIANFIYHWNQGDVQNHSWIPPTVIMDWPGNSLYTGLMMAPYVDFNGDNIYNYADGDYPLIKGDQMIWSVYNDVFGSHKETGSPNNFGIEVHSSAYAFTCPGIADSNAVLNNTTFYHYEIFNWSMGPYDSTCISLWIDSDLGNYQDDYIGCDVTNDFGYTYNGDAYDDDNGSTPGYHTNLPVFACNILQGPIADAGDGIDNNHNCQIDETGEHCMMSGFTSYNNTGSQKNGILPTTNGYIVYDNLMRGKWEDGTLMTYGNQGVNAINQPSKYLYPGNTDPYGFALGGNCNNPVTPTGSFGTTGWTERQAGNFPGDRRMIVNTGKFTMQPYFNVVFKPYTLDCAFVFSQDSANCDTNSACLINRATQDNIRVKKWFNANNYPSCSSNVGIKKNTMPQLDLNLYPNPANMNVYVEFTNMQKNVTIEVFDMLGNVVQGLQYNELSKYAIIPVSELQSGVYMVKIQSAEGTANKKFIKQ
jgi:hypothetical protein